MDEPKITGMFFGSYDFLPERLLTQDELNVITIELLRRLFVKKIDGKEIPFPVPEAATTQEQLAKLYIDMRVAFRPDVFETLPKEVKKHFIVKERSGAQYRYGRKPRSLR